MVAEKMKLKILEAISEDLAREVDSKFELLLKQKNVPCSLEDLIDSYLSFKNKSKDLISSTRQTSDVIETKRDIAFIFYCISCPFYFSLGVSERLHKDRMKDLLVKLTIKKSNLHDYITSGKHHYRLYSKYREMINSFVYKYIIKE